MKTLQAIFLADRIGQISRNKLNGFRRFFDFFCASKKIVFLGPMRSLETTFQEKSYYPGEKKDFGLFSQITDYCRHRVTFFWALQVFWATIVRVPGAFFQHPRGCWKHKVLKKKAIFPIETKTSGHFFSFSEKKILRNKKQGSRKCFDIFVQVFKFISLKPLRSIETTFQKKAIVPMKKNFGLFISHNSLLQTPSSFSLGSKKFLGFYDASSKINSSTTKRLLKTKTLEEKGYCCNWKHLRPFFLV